MVTQMKNTTTYPTIDNRLRQYKDILNFVKTLNLEEREELIREIEVDKAFEEYKDSVVVKE
ncbi:hypothetical protein LCGC14_0801490 [marine sediment metagenome]|uniref:Uncharacterized protein n=1 Tax=marine sediment metagenome TaxID=412755 RepID=A0A0F9S9G0_9ZZZZ